MATTTNYGWTTPDDTDLVKDGAAAIRTLGSSVDTTTKALNPETTTGDIAYRSATANTNTRLALGTAGQVLTVNSGATAPEWAAPAAAVSGLTLIKTQTIGSGVTTITVTDAFNTTYENYVIMLSGGVGAANNGINLTLDSTATGYYRLGYFMGYGSSTITGQNASNASFFQLATSGADGYGCVAHILQPFKTVRTTFFTENAQLDTGGYINKAYGMLADSTSYTDFTLSIGAGLTVTGGTIKVYGYQTS
jgi:hypothetical protein